jgi:hypothetical protein
MKRRNLSAILAAVGFGLVLSSHALAVTGPYYSAPGTWNENPYYNGFGGPLPPGIVEGSAGFSTIGDYDGRTIALAGVTTDTADSDPLTTITTGLFSGSDANLYEIAITNPATFTASVTSPNLILALFSPSGAALEAAVGGTTNSDTITGTAAGVTSPGIYFLGIADPSEYPLNNEGQNIFGLTGATGTFTPVTGDTALSTTVATSWTTPLANTSFVAPSSTITLTGAGFAVVPEPTTLGLLGVASLGLLARRRNRA